MQEDLKKYYETQMEFKKRVKEVEEEKTTAETLWMVAKAYVVDIMVTGMHGRKGPKE